MDVFFLRKALVQKLSFSLWKSKGWSDEIIKVPTTSDNSLAPRLNPT